MRMRRFVLYILAFLFLAFTASFLWSIYTVTGTSFLLKGIVRVLPGAVEMKEVTGRIGYSLHVEGLKLHLTDLEVAVDTADLTWQPLYLVTGKLAIITLRVHSVSITDSAPPEDKPVDLLFPTVPKWFSMFQGWVNELSVSNVKYMKSGSEPVSVDGISATILWDRGILSLTGVNAKTDYGSVTGAVMTNLSRPALRARLTMTLPKSAAGIDTMLLDARLPSSKGEEQIAGPLVVKAGAGAQEHYSLQCRLAVTRHTLRLSGAKLTKKPGKGSVEADGTLDLSGNEPAFTFAAKLTGLDLAPEVPMGTDLSGNITIAGTMEDFTGTIDLKNLGTSWKEIALKGNLRGDGELIELKDLEARLLGGTVHGRIDISRAQDMTLSAGFTGKNLNPARIRPGLEGNLNFEAKGKLKLPENQPMEGSLVARLKESRFQKRAISADLDASFRNETIKVNALTARGNGFAATASGTVQERLSYEVRIDDASKLLPGATGSLFANGWARWLKNEPAGVITARGKNISYDLVKVSSFNAVVQMPEGYKGTIAIDAAARNASYDTFRTDTVSLKVNGTTGDHTIALALTSNKDRIDALAQGKYADEAWRGTILKVSGTQAPFGRWDLAGPSTAHISKKRMSLSPFALTSTAGERIDMSANITLEPMVGFAAAQWRQVNLARANRLIGQAKIEGRTSGTSHVQWQSGKRMVLSGDIDASGLFSQGSMKVNINSVNGKLNWDRSGLIASCDIDLGDKGRMNTRISSRRPAAFSLPDQGAFQANWMTLDIGIVQPMLPDAVHLKGRLSGEVAGNLVPGNRFNLTGKTGISDGSISWRSDQGEITAPIRQAAVGWTWKDTSLKGNLNLALSQYGHAEASFQVPVAAKLPLALDSKSPTLISARGAIQEKGLLAALFPGLAQETGGQIDFDVTAGGTFADPRLNGRLALKGASAYLPPVGIRLKDVSAEVIFNNDRINIASFLARSGSGYIGGSGMVQHENLRIRTLEGTIKGERFQAVDLPELQAAVSPQLTVTGDARKISVRGSLLIPEALIREEKKENLVKPSPDVVIQGRKKKAKQVLPFAIDVAIAVELGDKVLVKAYGIDTGLRGKVTVTMKDPNDIRASGNISTVKGKFDAYGVKLDVKRGRIAFGGGPVNQATLDVLALRTVSDVSAGVLVTGTPASPLVNLYSEPAMPDMDILSYIVLGRPRGTSGQADTALLARAASALLTSGKSSTIQKQLGLDVIDVESTGGDLSQSIVKIGKYLSPDLYISYGRSIYTGENLFGLRYSLTRRLDVESTMGNQSSAVIYYKIEFD